MSIEYDPPIIDLPIEPDEGGVPTGGTTGQVLAKNSGTDYDTEWVDQSGGGGTPGGSDTQVQFNDGGAFGADANLVFDKTTDSLGVQVAAPLNPLHVAGVTGSTINSVVTASVTTTNETLNTSPTGSIALLAEFPALGGSSANQNASGSGYTASGQTIDYNIYQCIYDASSGAFYRSQFYESVSFQDFLGNSDPFSVTLSFGTASASCDYFWIEKQVNGGGYGESVLIAASSTYEDENFSGSASYSAWGTQYAISYTTPVNPTGGASGFWNTGFSGLTADGATYTIEIKSYTSIGGLKYVDDANAADTGGFTDPNDMSAGAAELSWGSGTADGYIVRVTRDGGSFWSYHDVGGTTTYVYDGESNTPTDPTAEGDWSRGISTFTGVEYAFKCYAKNTAPSGVTVYTPSANTYYGTISSPSVNYMFIHTYTGLPGSGGKVIADYNSGVVSGRDVTGTFIDPGYSSWVAGTTITPNSYAFANGTTRYFKLVGTNGTIFSPTLLVVNATTSGSQYFSGSFSYPSGVTTVKILLSTNGVTYTGSKSFSGGTTTFTYDAVDTSWGGNTTITPTASVPTTARIDRQQTLATDVPHLALVEVTGSGTRLTSLGFGVAASSNASPTFQSNLISYASTGYLGVGTSRLIGYTNVNQSAESFTLGNANALNLSKSSSVHFLVYASNATDPLAYFYSASNSGRGTLYLGTTSLTGSVGDALLCVAPQAGGGAGTVYRRTSGFTGDNIRIDEAGSYKAGWGQAGRMYLNATSVSTTTYLLIGGTGSGSQIRLAAGSVGTVEGDISNSSSNKCLTAFVNSIQQYDSRTLYSQIATATVANTTTETSLVNTTGGVGTIALPANFFVGGKRIKITARGFYSSVSSPTINLRLKLGSTTVCLTGAVTSGAATSKGWKVEGEITCRTNGASGTVFGQGEYQELHSAGISEALLATATTTINTTSVHNVGLTAQWGTASASNTISCTNFTLEVCA